MIDIILAALIIPIFFLSCWLIGWGLGLTIGWLFIE